MKLQLLILLCNISYYIIIMISIGLIVGLTFIGAIVGISSVIYYLVKQREENLVVYVTYD